MPRVPTYDNFQANQTGVQNVPFQAGSGPNAAQIEGQQLQQAGGALATAGEAASRIALSMQDQVNQVRVNDAVNQARKAAQDLAYNPQTGYLGLKGNAALDRPDGKDLTTEYGDKLQEQMSQIAGTLGNDIQRRQFAMNANDLSTQFHGQIETHMLSEFRSHALSVQDGTIDLASDDAKRNWNNPDLIAPSLNAAKAAVYQKGQVSGWSAAQTDAALLATTSKVHADVIMSALANNNPSYAQTYLAARRGEMSADDILRVQGHVNQADWMNQSLGAVQAATTKTLPQLAPTNFDRMTQITLGAESGGQRYGPDGKTLLTSPAGAKGEMQVLDGTNKDPGFGVRPAQNDSPDERARVGRDYLQAMLQKYGDPAKAWAAYNAGPGRLDQAIAGTSSKIVDYGYGPRQDGTPKGRGFLGPLKRPDGSVSTEITIGVNLNGRETEIPTLVPTLSEAEKASLLRGDDPSPAIVQKAVDFAKGRLAAGKGVFADNNSGSDWLAAMPKETQAYVAANVKALQGSGGIAPRPTELEFVNSALAQLPPGAPPQVVKMTREQAGSQFTMLQKSMNEQGDNALSSAQRWLAQNNGALSQMPPEIRDAVDRFAPGKSDDLIKYARVFERGENQTDLRLYNRLAAHPDEMAGMTDAQFETLRPSLSQADFKHFANERSSQINGKSDESASAINMTAVRAALTPRLEGLGINAAPAPKDTDGRERIGGIQKFVRDSLFDAQRQLGKKMTPDEVDQHIDNLFAKSVDFRNSLWGTTSTQNLMSMQLKDLPSGAVDGLRQALVNNGNKSPTNNDIVNLYRKLHVSK